MLREFSAGRDKVAMDAFRADVAAFAKAEEELLAILSSAADSTLAALEAY